MTAGWAALNTLREAVRSLAGWESVHGVEESPEWEQRQAALALVQTALEAAEAVVANQILVMYDNAADPMWKLAAALRAVREGK